MTRRSPFGFLSLSLSFVSFFSPQFSSKKTALLRGSAQQKLTTKNETDEYSTHFKILEEKKGKKKRKEIASKRTCHFFGARSLQAKKKKVKIKKFRIENQIVNEKKNGKKIKISASAAAQ